MKCPQCRMESPDQGVLCQYCGFRWVAVDMAPPVRPVARPRAGFVDDHFKSLLISLLIILMIMGGTAGYVYVVKVPHMEIVSADASYDSNSDMQFVVDVRNTGWYTRSTTIVCTVSYDSDSSTYDESLDITLGPGETQTYDIVVIIYFYYTGETAHWECHLE